VLAGVPARGNSPAPPRLQPAVALAVAVLIMQVSVAWLLSNHVAMAVGTAALIPGLALLLVRPHWLWAFAFPANFLAMRVGPTGLDLSLADVGLLVAVVAAMPSVPWRSRVVQRMQRLFVVYLAIMLIVYAAVPNKETLVSLAQRSSMFVGAILVGAAIGAHRRTREALIALLAAAMAVAVDAIRRSVTTNYAPAYPFSIHKNNAGAMLGMSIVVSFAAFSVFRRTRLARVLVGGCQIILAGGLLATGARGAAFALLAALVVAVARNEPGARRPITLAVLACVGLVAYATVKSVDRENQTNQYSSANSRVVTYNAALKLWERDPLVGVGIKYWRNPAYANEIGFGEPHNVIVATLAETGVVGLVAFTVLMAGTFLTAFRRRSPMFRIATLVMVFYVVNGQFGIFWVAVGGSLAWLVLGMAIGHEFADSERPQAASHGDSDYGSEGLPTAVR
jgi:O-antigen ligase